jgi:hypothetical protein
MMAMEMELVQERKKERKKEEGKGQMTSMKKKRR